MTQQFAKFISEDTVKFAPRNLKTPFLIAFNFNQNEELMRSQQYYPLVYLEEPTTEEGYWSKPQYELCSETIQEENDEGQFVDVNRQYIAVHYVLEEIVDEGDE